MKTATVRKKQLAVDSRKLARLRRFLNARSEAEALDRAIDLALAEEDIKRELGQVRGKGSIRRVFE